MIYVMADIHGHYDRFMDILGQINLQPEDHLYVLGDVIDRNPGGIDVLRHLMHMPNATLLLGNHEYMMLESIGNSKDMDAWLLWLYNGGGVTNDAIMGLSDEELNEIITYLECLPVNIEIEVNGTVYLLVHGAPEATFHPFRTKHPNSKMHAIWSRIDRYARMPEGKTIILGHTPTTHYQQKRPLRIWHGDRMIGIDCGCSTSEYGCLACLRLDDMKEFYTLSDCETQLLS